MESVQPLSETTLGLYFFATIKLGGNPGEDIVGDPFFEILIVGHEDRVSSPGNPVREL